MKLNDFVKKPRNTKPIKPQTQFVLQNDAAIRKYQDQINELDIQLGYYRTIEAERDNAVSKLTLEKEKTTEAQDEVNRLNTVVTDLNATIDYQAKQLEQIPALIEQTKTAQGDF
jgi:predicted RNase H-like nuclease (RuvC/YqgF family)